MPDGNGERIILVGAGRMGAALAAGWLKGARGLSPDRLLIIDPDPSDSAKDLIRRYDLKSAPALGPSMAADVGMVVLAMKPQQFEVAATPLAKALPPGAAVLSILAGVSLRQLQDALGSRPLVRAMPNTAAAIGKGISVAIANEAGLTVRKQAEALLKPGGPVEWVTDERQMSAVTALSGSGPAYVFLMCEALAGAGFAEGLPRPLAEKLARATVAGAGAMLAESKETPQALRMAVTSPGGTTQAALDVMMGEGGLPDLMRHAVSAAERRARQLGGGSGGRGGR